MTQDERFEIHAEVGPPLEYQCDSRRALILARPFLRDYIDGRRVDDGMHLMTVTIDDDEISELYVNKDCRTDRFAGAMSDENGLYWLDEVEQT